MDQALGAFQHAMQNPLGRGHLPQHIHMDAATAVGALMRDLGLGDAAADRIGDQLFMPLAPRAAVIMLGNEIAVGVVAVGIDAGKRADPAGRGPCAGAFAIGDSDPLAAFDQRQGFDAGDFDRI